MTSNHLQRGDFLPNLCSLQAVFRLVVLGELLALVLLLAKVGIQGIDGYNLGVMSIAVQWVCLASAGALCQLRDWFRRVSPQLAGTVAYALVQLVTLVVVYFGGSLQRGDWLPRWADLYSQLLLSMVLAGVVLRYFYLQQQLHNQVQAELRARIQALQSRIRPHFLFNSMNSIASLIAIDPEAAERMVEDLCDLFRASLSEPGLVPMSKELDVCRRFVRIEQTRLGERLQVEWVIDEAALKVQVPSLLLQPLIENAIYHGVAPLPAGGLVKIEVGRQGKHCRLAITNPLPDPAQLNTKGNGLALENIRNRLAAHYGEGTRWFNQLDAGLYRVIVEFPAELPETT